MGAAECDMADTTATKRASLVEDLKKASEDVARLRRELTEAEGRRDAALAQVLAAGTSLRDVVLPPPPKVVVGSNYQSFLERVKVLTREFGRRDAEKASDFSPRTVGHYLRWAMKDGLIKRVAIGRYILAAFAPKA